LCDAERWDNPLTEFTRLHNDSISRIEEAVKKRIAELEQAYAAALEVNCPHTLRRVVIDELHDRIASKDLRIAELEKALATLMDEYLCRNGFDTHYYAAAVALCF